MCQHGFLRWKSDIPPDDVFPVCCSRNPEHKRRFVSDLSDSVLRSASRPTSLTGMWSITSMRSIPETSASSPSECYWGFCFTRDARSGKKCYRCIPSSCFETISLQKTTHCPPAPRQGPCRLSLLFTEEEACLFTAHKMFSAASLERRKLRLGRSELLGDNNERSASFVFPARLFWEALLINAINTGGKSHNASGVLGPSRSPGGCG